MKTIYIIPFLLIGCKSPQQLIDKAVKKQPDILSQFDTVIQVPEIYYDTIYHSDTFELVRTIRMTDTIIKVQQIAPKSKYDYKHERDVLRHELKMAKIEAQKYKDSLTEARKTAKIEGRTNRTDIRRSKRAEIVKEKARTKPWMWLLIGFALAHLIRWVLIIVRSFTKMPI